MPNIGPLEIAIVVIIALIVFGPKKLPELGSSLGKGMREFKASISGDDGPDESLRVDSDVDDVDDVDEPAAEDTQPTPVADAAQDVEAQTAVPAGRA